MTTQYLDVAGIIGECIPLVCCRNSEDARAGDLEMQAANQSVVTQDGELLAVNGKLLSANYGGGAPVPRALSVASVTTVCSCTCYPRQRHFSPDPRNR